MDIEGYNTMRLSLHTYCYCSLMENDFILAAKIEKVYEGLEKKINGRAEVYALSVAMLF